MRANSVVSLLLCLLLVFVLAGCSSDREFYSESSDSTLTAEPAATTPADGNPDDVTCKGSYYVSDDEIAAVADSVVATAGDAKLTVGQLQVYYWLEAAAHRISDHPDQPDFSQSLDAQSCPVDDTVNSWQQYFLKKALSTWHAHQALALMSQQDGVPSYDPEYKPDLAKRSEYMTGMPATEVLYQWSESYKPNRLHQDYLDAIPEMLEILASDNGFGSNDAQAKAIAGAGASSADLISYAQLSNLAYMYFTEMGYYFEPTAEEIEAYSNENPSDQNSDGKTVNIRHILLIPENADIADDGTVTASEDDWNRCRVQAQSVVEKWKTAISKTRYSQFTAASVPESRFSEIAKDYSQDTGSAANGGAYVQLEPGQLMPELDAWCFDDARQHGDYETFRTAAGYHILFFSASNENRYTDAEIRLNHSLYEELRLSAMEKYPAKIDYSAVKLGVA